MAATDASNAPVPAYGRGALTDVTPSLLAALGVPGEQNVLELPSVRRVCVLLVDGLGWDQLVANSDVAPYLSSLSDGAVGGARDARAVPCTDGAGSTSGTDPAGDARPPSRAGGRSPSQQRRAAPHVVTAGFPATTATSMGSLGTGLAPGEHGLLGLRVAIPGTDRLMNCLHWDKGVEPVSWQPRPTVFERAEAAGVAASHHAPGAFRDGGLTRAALRGSRYYPADSPGELVATAGEALHAHDRALACVYYADLDATGHRKGCETAAWRFQLAHVDRLAEQLAGVLPPDTTLYVTADHGMVDVHPQDRVDADSVPELREGVSLLGGEPRARHVYARSGAAGDVLELWRVTLGDRMWVASREEAVAAGWFGREVPAEMLERIGDVVAASRDGVAVIASRIEPHESTLIGQHGSMTRAEQHVPLLTSSPA